MTRLDRVQARENLDALADTLAAVAIEAQADGGLSQQAGSAALHTLILAMMGGQGTAYSGAVQRIVRIVEQAEDRGMRAGALSALLSMPDATEMLKYFEQVATSRNPVAYVAVGFLARETGPRGVAVLRTLYRRGAIVEPHAQREIEALAYHFGWTGEPRSP